MVAKLPKSMLKSTSALAETSLESNSKHRQKITAAMSKGVLDNQCEITNNGTTIVGGGTKTPKFLPLKQS